MGNPKLLSEEETAHLVGVSLDTIRQYAELGILRTHEEGDLRFFTEGEVEEIFGPWNIGVSKADSVDDGLEDQKKAASGIEIVGVSQEETIVEDQKREPLETTGSVTGDFAHEAIAGQESLKTDMSEKAGGPHGRKIISMDASKDRRSYSYLSTEDTPGTMENSSYLEVEHSDPGLLEVNVLLRQQLQQLTEERNWLRRRVEAFEARAHRDQVILLSHSEEGLKKKGDPSQRSLLSMIGEWLYTK